jgi:carbamoyl-phosphate synthase large subunit
MNVQFAVKDGDVYLLEVNPRASRTVPFVAKATDSAIASIAARLMAGETLDAFPLRAPYPNASYDTPLPYADPMTLADPAMPWFSVKEAVLPFARFPGVDTILGPEMRSTGEVMGWDRSFARAFLKAQMGAGVNLPARGAPSSPSATPTRAGDAGGRAHPDVPGLHPPRHPRAPAPGCPPTASRRIW